MKKYFLIIIMLISLPTLVLAKDTCNDNDIKIKSITLKELNGFSEEIQESSINNNTINLNLKMYDVGDSSTYEITVENTSNEDYYFTKDSMKLENDYLEYSLKNDSEIIPAKEEKTIKLKVSYKNQIPNENYSDTNKLIISLSDKPLENPKTKMTYTFIFIIISLLMITIFIKMNNKPFNKKKLLLIVASLSIIPLTTFALCTVNLNVETKIEIENKEAIFLPGREVNAKMKQLAGDDTSTASQDCFYQDTNIQALKYSNKEPIETEKEEKNIVSASESPYPIYMWYEDGTIYWWSEDSHPSINEKSDCMFYYMKNLSEINTIKDFDTSQMTDLNSMFCYTSINDLSPIKNWNTSKVKNMNSIFAGTSTITDISQIKDWDTSQVYDLMSSFSGTSISDISPITNWDTSSLTRIAFLLASTNVADLTPLKDWDVSKVNFFVSLFMNNHSLTSLHGLENWDTSSVTHFNNMCFDCPNLKDITAMKNWDVSNVISTYGMFYKCTSLEDITSLKNWNTSSLSDMNYSFDYCTSLRSLSGLENWDVSNVTNFAYAFRENYNLEDASAINDWDISPNARFTGMFFATPIHPEFTKVQGTWNSAGTFIPST